MIVRNVNGNGSIRVCYSHWINPPKDAPWMGGIIDCRDGQGCFICEREATAPGSELGVYTKVI